MLNPASLFEELAWLERCPADFRAQVRALADSSQPGPAIRQMASHALSSDELAVLAKGIGKLVGAQTSLHPLVPFKLGLIGNGTLDYIASALVGTAARFGFALECLTGDYDQVLQEAIEPGSRINQAGLDAVLVAVDYRALPLQCQLGSEGDAEAAAERGANYLRTIAAGLRDHGGAQPILQTVAAPPEALFGGLDRTVPGTMFDVIARLNRKLAGSFDGSERLLLDVARIADIVGLARWHDPAQWNLAKLPFAADYVPFYADHVCRLIAALRGKSRKVLVLDLDNTLWGGIIGDDGMEGIKLAQGDATGEAHLAVQSYALALRERGVILAVSSKNEDAVARAVFRDHPEMLLREQHIAVFQANWSDKATNMQAIATELSLGLDSFVFLDDNPVERALVRRSLPQIAVPELPDDPALFMRTLAAAGYFDTVAFSQEDRARADFYQRNARRAELQAGAVDLDAYLASLEMVIEFGPFDAASRARITQLINKSNQFNLTTRRYTENEVGALEHDPSIFTLQVRLTDRFGDNGMISTVICRPDASGRWVIDTWLMSCRVLGRKVEQMVLRELFIHARKAGIARLRGLYRPTDRNMMVRDHYRKLGFLADEANAADGDAFWQIDVPSEPGPELMTVKRRFASQL